MSVKKERYVNCKDAPNIHTDISINGNADSQEMFNFVTAWIVPSCILDTRHEYDNLRKPKIH